MSVGAEGSGPNPRTYSRAEYAVLEAENARLTAQLAAIQGGMGEEVEVEVVAWAWDCLGPHVTVDAIQAAELQSISVKLEPLMTVAQHQRITAAMAAEVERKTASRDKLAAILRDLVPGCKWRIMRPRIDAALLEIENGDQ